MALEASTLLEMLDLLWTRGQDVLTAIPPSQLRALTVIDVREAVNLRDLGQALGSTPPSVSRLCDRLEAAGLIERARATGNRRELEVRLARGGRAVLAEVRAARAGEVQAVLAHMPPAQQQALFEGMAAFNSAALHHADVSDTVPVPDCGVPDIA
ncbi:MarR family winged helix-turn-helix transcriptional regulator [Streptomyces sp. cmx-4-9]|uniref:MarR family winged helix-turn-helix transcriptional regulator n=1 Tax=Streptomyces sp. cmx-4-9 TaxID=2790941 RepID=UPI00397EAB67